MNSEDGEFHIVCPYCVGEFDDSDDWSDHVSSDRYKEARANRESLDLQEQSHPVLQNELARQELKLSKLAEELEEQRAKVLRAEEDRECKRAEFEALSEQHEMLDEPNAQKRVNKCDSELQKADKRLRTHRAKEESLEDKMVFQRDVIEWITSEA